MRTGSIVSSAIALFVLRVHGAPERKLEALTEGDTLTKMEEFFGVKLERKFNDLPTSARLEKAPWNGPIWETYADSINYPWKANQPSPTEKYAMAFGLNATELKYNVSAAFGLYSVSDSKPACSSSCKDEEDVCTNRNGMGICIPRWFGLSQGLAPAAIFEKEPLCPITFNNVEFYPNDIKGLISAVYAGANSSKIFGGKRYHDKEVSLDQYGRPTEANYRDVTPAFFHITLANIIGKLKRSLIIDRFPGHTVWNQALSAFEVYEQKTMTPEEAAKSFFNTDKYPFNDQATQIIYVVSSVFWNNTPFPTDEFRPLIQDEDFYATYSYILEITAAGDICGGEWVNKSIHAHADYLYVVKEKPAADLVTSVGFSYANVLKLLEMSAACPNTIQIAN
ncbi:putative transglutaminase elicitor [Plasmopara halstedii]